MKGLKSSSFLKPTSVQKKSLKHTLSGKDVVVEAKTGSGKTLVFVITILEYIYIERITAFDGPVAVILTPTRELAKQIFAVFHRVGKFHNFTMIDIMGGKTRVSYLFVLPVCVTISNFRDQCSLSGTIKL